MFNIREINVAIEAWGVVFCLIGIVCTLLLVRTNKTYRNMLVGMFSLELLAAVGDAITQVNAQQPGEFARALLLSGNSVAFMATFILQACITYYLCSRFQEAGGSSYKPWRIGVTAAALVMCVLTLCGAFFYFDEANIYHRASAFLLSGAYVALASLVNMVLVVLNRRALGRTALVCLTFYTVAPMVASVAQMFIYGPNLAIAVGVLGLIVVFLEMQAHSAHSMVAQAEELARSQAEATESRIVAMVSQIQPHFLFNTLDTIYGLVDEDTTLAKDAIASFSRYLRTNLASLNQTNPVPVETEMEHVRTYLELERMSDPGRVSYELDVSCGGFSVPALAVQTLVENAVKHGISKRTEGGMVKVGTRELPDAYQVCVEDNGVGYNAQEAADESEPHIGISNTRQRLEAMCGGTLSIEGEPGAGTRAVIHIPKEQA